MERMTKVQEVILKAMAGSLQWWEAAEIIGVSDPDDEAVAETLPGGRLRRAIPSPEAAAESQTGGSEDG
jgi:hypothetical protein